MPARFADTWWQGDGARRAGCAEGPKEDEGAPPMNHDLFDKGQQSAQIAARVGTRIPTKI